MSIYKKISIHLIDAISEAILKNENLDINEYAQKDAETLIKAGNLLLKAIKERDTNLEQKFARQKKRSDIWVRQSNQPEYLKRWVTGLTSACYYHVVFEGKIEAIVKKDSHTEYCGGGSGNVYSEVEYFKIRKDTKNYWHDKGEKIHTGRVNKKDLERFLKMVK